MFPFQPVIADAKILFAPLDEKIGQIAVKGNAPEAERGNGGKCPIKTAHPKVFESLIKHKDLERKSRNRQIMLHPTG
jgi:hypothetical protein